MSAKRCLTTVREEFAHTVRPETKTNMEKEKCVTRFRGVDAQQTKQGCASRRRLSECSSKPCGQERMEHEITHMSFRCWCRHVVRWCGRQEDRYCSVIFVRLKRICHMVCVSSLLVVASRAAQRISGNRELRMGSEDSGGLSLRDASDAKAADLNALSSSSSSKAAVDKE